MRTVASVARKIIFAHIAKDGKTPVVNTLTGKWTYTATPTETQMTQTVTRLSEIQAVSAEASTTAKAAKKAADDAQETADSKVTLGEVQESLFPATDKNGNPVVMTSLTFSGSEDGWGFQFCYHPIGKPNQATCAAIAYVPKSTFDALEKRVKDLETKLAAASK